MVGPKECHTKWNKSEKDKYMIPLIKSESESHSVMSDSLWPHELYSPWNSPGQNTGMGNLSLLQGIFPTQGSNPGLLHCRQILYQLSHQGSPRILEWVVYPFSNGSSWPRNWTGVSCIAGGYFTSWASKQNLKRKNWYKRTYSQKGHRLKDLREQIYGYQGERVWGRDRLGVWDWHVHTGKFKTDNQQGPNV